MPSQPILMRPDPIPQAQQFDIARPINAYYAGQQNRLNRESKEKNLAMADAKLQEYQETAPQRRRGVEMQANINRLQHDEAFKQAGMDTLSGVDPDAPIEEFNRAITDSMVSYEKRLVNDFGFTPDAAGSTVQRILESGGTTPEAVRAIQIENGIRPKQATPKTQIVDGQLVTIRDGKAVATDIKGLKAKDLKPVSKIGKEKFDLQQDIDNGFITQNDISDVESGTTNPKEFEQTMKLRKEYVSDAKQFMDVRNAYGRILASAGEPSGAGDLAMIFNYMKMLDPTSVVRESEYATAKGAAAVPERLKGAYDAVISGDFLSDKQRADFVDRAGKLHLQTIKQHDKRKNQFTRISTNFGLDPNLIVIDIGLAGQQGPPSEVQQGPQTAEDYMSKFRGQ